MVTVVASTSTLREVVVVHRGSRVTVTVTVKVKVRVRVRVAGWSYGRAG